MRQLSYRFAYSLCILASLIIPVCAQAQQPTPPAMPAAPTMAQINVVDYGAVADGKTDNTAAFQKALDAAGADNKAGIVFVPQGQFLFKGNLVIPRSVTLMGSWKAPVTADQFWTPTQAGVPLEGAVLLPTAGEGQAEGAPFITLSTNSLIQGLTIFYPTQTKTNPPKPFPWTVGLAKGGTSNSSIIDMLMVNPYQAVDFGSQPSGRHFIRNLNVHALHRGIFVDQCYDIGRIENVHVWPFWGYTGDDDPLGKYVSEKAIAFQFGRTDWEYVTNCFSIFYNKGFVFGSFSANGPGNVLLTQSGADVCPEAVVVETSQAHAGITFANSQLFGRITVKETNAGPVRFTGCGFFGASRETQWGETAYADLAGSGLTSFSNCHFITLDAKNPAKIGILARKGGLSVANCQFMDRGKEHIILNEGVRTAVVTGNTFAGAGKIINNSKGNVQIANNVNDEPAPQETK